MLFRRKTDARNSDTKVFGISYDDALALLKKYNEDPFHITHGETVSKLMRYYAKKYDPQNEEFWVICGLLHDLDWEK